MTYNGKDNLKDDTGSEPAQVGIAEERPEQRAQVHGPEPSAESVGCLGVGLP